MKLAAAFLRTHAGLGLVGSDTLAGVDMQAVAAALDAQCPGSGGRVHRTGGK
jgi:hypothetical protein